MLKVHVGSKVLSTMSSDVPIPCLWPLQPDETKKISLPGNKMGESTMTYYHILFYTISPYFIKSFHLV